MPRELVSAIESTGVGAQQPLHPGNQVGLGGLDHQVKVVGHQAERVHLPVGLGTALAQGFQETLPVSIVLEDGIPPIPTIHHMINGSFIFDSQLARHRPNSAQTLL